MGKEAKKFELVDFLKGYSIFTIVIFHLLQQTNGLPALLDKGISFGGTGVHLFILLSGFGLYLSFEKKPIGFISFLRRRFGKIYIPYIFIISISALITLFIPIYKGSLFNYFGHVFFYKMFDRFAINSYGYQMWFISTIVQFYLVFHLLAWYIKRVNEKLFILTGLIISITWSLTVVALGNEDFRNWNSFFLQFLWEFMIGMAIAKRINSGQQFIPVKTGFLLVIGIIGSTLYAALALKGGQVGKMFNDIPALIGYTSLAIFLYQLNITPLRKFFLYTGKVSYSLYLIHLLIMLLIIHFFSKNAGLGTSLFYMGIALLLSYLTAHWYNKLIALFYKKTGL